MITKHRLEEAAFLESPNHGGALKKPKFIVAHYTGGRSASSAARWLCSKAAKASAHLVIGRDGTLIQLVPFDTVAWHAGESTWEGIKGINSCSIGIELDCLGHLNRVNGRWRSLGTAQDVPDADVMEVGGRAFQLYSQTQLALFETICRELIEAYPTIRDVIGHSDICIPKGRKLDPGPALDLDVLRSKLFGRQ